MAKNRRVVTANPMAESRQLTPAKASLFSPQTGQLIATTMLTAAIVYVAFWPHDSVEVQHGAARYLVAWILATAVIAIVSFGRVNRFDWMADLSAWCLAGWMAVSLTIQAGHANVRLGINECGWWLATAALITTVRRVTVDPQTAAALLRLVIAASLGVAVFGWHQHLIGFPQTIAEYQADPDRMLRQLEIVAPPGSAMRIIFENRLYDGGPTGTFALANSLAAMLLGGLVAMIGILISAWRDFGMNRRVLWIAGTATVAGMLLATSSRTAVVALLLLGASVAVVQLRHYEDLAKKIQGWFRGLATVAVIGMAGLTSGIYLLKGTAWFQQAPLSLAIRFSYWRACFGMLSENLWLGVGPGQFKARYESFRAAASTEQIADPHQFLLQTVTTGGLPALVLLLALLALLGWRFRHAKFAVATTESKQVQMELLTAKSNRGVLVGAMMALSGAWLIGGWLGLLLDREATLAASLAAIGIGTLGWYGFDCVAKHTLAPRRLRTIAGLAAAGMGIDLLASGGMTVPGVSAVAWLFVGIAAPVQFCGEGETIGSQQKDWIRVGFTSVAVVALVTWYRIGIAPIEKSTLLQNQFATAWQRGQVDVATDSLMQAAVADRWDVQPPLRLAEAYCSLSMAQSARRSEWEAKWDVAEQTAIRRASLDPVLFKQLGDGRLQSYQQYGDQVMLNHAETLFARAVTLSPSHEGYAAQWAEVLRELGDPRAASIAARAAELSRLGGFYERSLAFTMILPAQNIGRSPVVRPAAEVLQNTDQE